MFDFWKLLSLLARIISFMAKIPSPSADEINLLADVKNMHRFVKLQLDDTPSKL